MTTNGDALPKASLYYYPPSIWSAVALLTLEEKGYGDDEIDLKMVDLGKGENYLPSYLRINPKATVPTLVVPLETTLSSEIESRYKAIHDTKAIVEFLDKSRSTQSRTHTTSSAPSPSLSPATIAFSAASNKIITILHSEAADPNLLLYLNGRDDTALKQLASERLEMLRARRDTLQKLLDENAQSEVRVSEKTRQLWETKKAGLEKFLEVYEDADKDAGALSADAAQKRADYIAQAREAWANLKIVLPQVAKEIIGPYVLGDQLSIVDLHLAAWFARVAKLSGATVSDDGATVVQKLGEHIGDGFTLPKDFSIAEARRRAGVVSEADSTEKQSRLAAFWDAVRERPSFKKVYVGGLH